MQGREVVSTYFSQIVGNLISIVPLLFLSPSISKVLIPVGFCTWLPNEVEVLPARVAEDIEPMMRSTRPRDHHPRLALPKFRPEITTVRNHLVVKVRFDNLVELGRGFHGWLESSIALPLNLADGFGDKCRRHLTLDREGGTTSHTLRLVLVLAKQPGTPQSVRTERTKK